MPQLRCRLLPRVLRVLSRLFLSDLAAAFIVRTFTFASCDGLELVEEFDLFDIVAYLQVLVVDDYRPFQDRRILHDEIAEFVQGHRFDVDVLFLDYLGSLGDYVVRTVFRTRYDVLYLFLVQQGIEYILLNEFEIVFLQV